MHPVVQEIINQLKPYKAEKIILFGSYAYGRPQEDSDVDLVLIKKTMESFWERQKKARMLLHTTTAVDLFVLTEEEFNKAQRKSSFFKEIGEKGVVLYG